MSLELLENNRPIACGNLTDSASLLLFPEKMLFVRPFMPITKYLLLLVLCGGLGSSATTSSAEEIAAGPFAYRFNLTLTPGSRVEAFGPLLSYERKDSQLQWALPPLLSYVHDRGTETEEFDFAYPLLSYDRFGSEFRFHFFQVFSFSGGHNQQDVPADRLTLFPFYFQQRSPDPAQNYTAFLPIYGHLKNRLFRDEINFLMMPLYVQTRKKDVVTDNYLFPLFHLRHGEALNGWQLWPVVGHEHKEPTSRTNDFGDVTLVGGHDKLFALWPFFFNNRLGIGTENPQTQRVLLPFYSLQRSPLRDSATYLWPFGFTVTKDREKDFREYGAPWPLIVFARGEGKTVNRFWPLFSQAHNSILESDFYLWPIYKYNRAQAEPLDRERTRILFFLYSDLIERNTATGAAFKRTDFWPLFTARRDFDGNERLQILALLEPFLPNNKSIERNYSPVWSLWRSEKNAKTGATSQSLFWNLYRRDTTLTVKKCSLLFGLIQYQSGPDGKRWRLFYIPVGKAQSPQPPQPKS